MYCETIEIFLKHHVRPQVFCVMLGKTSEKDEFEGQKKGATGKIDISKKLFE